MLVEKGKRSVGTEYTHICPHLHPLAVKCTHLQRI